MPVEVSVAKVPNTITRASEEMTFVTVRKEYGAVGWIRPSVLELYALSDMIRERRGRRKPPRDREPTWFTGTNEAGGARRRLRRARAPVGCRARGCCCFGLLARRGGMKEKDALEIQLYKEHKEVQSTLKTTSGKKSPKDLKDPLGPRLHNRGGLNHGHGRSQITKIAKPLVAESPTASLHNLLKNSFLHRGVAQRKQHAAGDVSARSLSRLTPQIQMS